MSTSREAFGVAVLDDILYVIGGCTVGMPSAGVYSIRQVTYHSLTEQYVPIGYSSTPFTANTDYKNHLTYITIVILALTVGLTGSLVFFLKYAKLFSKKAEVNA